MDSRPPHLLLLLLTGLLHLWHCARGQSSYIIDGVGLKVLPANTVSSGAAVTLHCQVRVSHDNIPHLKHTFQLTKDDVVVYSETTTEDSVTYILNPARAADSGNYECRVTVKDKSKTSHGLKLNVTGLQTPILYLNKTQPHENEEFTAICSAPKEKGSLNFRFYQKYRNGESQLLKQLAPTGNSSETTLVLRVVGDYFLYCDYEINLVSGPQRSHPSAEILVIVKGLHIRPVMNVLPSTGVLEGEVMEVVCRVVSHLKDVDVYLTRNSRILKQAKMSLSHRFTARDGDSGELVCKAEWGNVQKETYETITVREVISKPVLTVEPEDIFQGDLFKLTCSVTVYVPDKVDNGTLRFAIYKDGDSLNSSDTYVSLATPSRNGNYTCRVFTSVLEKQSLAVVVKAKIPVSKPELTVVGGTVVLGRPFQVRCHSATGTLPIIYTLHSSRRIAQQRVVRRPGEQAVFNASAVFDTLDLKSFLCHARQNNQNMPQTGQLSPSINIIEPVTKPVLKMLPSGGGVSEGQNVILACSVQKGTFPIKFSLYHYETGRMLFSTTSSKHQEIYKISDVGRKDQGGYYCVCDNPAGKAEQSLTFTITVKMAGWKKGLIGASCFLLIFALILVLIFNKRLIRFKRKTTVELPVKSVGTKAERLSLTQAEVNEAANATPGMMGKSVWSEQTSGSESDDQNSLTSPENPEPRYTVVHTRQADPNRAPVKTGTDTVYSEVRSSKYGAPEQPDAQASVEYAQLNHDGGHHADHGNHGDRSAQDAGTDEIDSSVDNNAVASTTADQGE